MPLYLQDKELVFVSAPDSLSVGGRMPLYLQDKELEQKWLLPDLSDQEMAEILDYEVPSEALEYWPVYTIRSTKPKPDDKSKVDTWEWPELPPLGSDEGLQQKGELF